MFIYPIVLKIYGKSLHYTAFSILECKYLFLVVHVSLGEEYAIFAHYTSHLHVNSLSFICFGKSENSVVLVISLGNSATSLRNLYNFNPLNILKCLFSV